MVSIKVLSTGLIYRNPKPHVRSVHAYFPSAVRFSNGDMLASIVLGEAFESANLHTHLCRSRDGGDNWSFDGPLYPGTRDRITSDASRLTALSSGEVVAFMVRHDRTDHPDEGLTNPANLGFVPTELLLLRSRDGGHTWSTPKPLNPPLEGPSFELCSPITVLRDGRWVLPTSTWPGWNGACPNGIRMVALVSHDQGRTWPEYWDVMNEPSGHVYFWESKIIEMSNGRLVSVAWAYDSKAAKDLPNQYVFSDDGGKTWSRPASMGLIGQTLTPLALPDDRILCVYRRTDTPGLWANVSHFDGPRWVNDFDAPLWGANVAGLTATSDNMSQNFTALRFGAPCVCHLSDKTVFVAFWCYEECVSVIRWFKLAISESVAGFTGASDR